MTLATGGDSTHDVGDYRYHVFTSTGLSTLTVTVGGLLEVLAVGGGGRGLGGTNNAGGGGGGGGVLETSFQASVQAYTVNVGAGGNVSDGTYSGVGSYRGEGGSGGSGGNNGTNYSQGATGAGSSANGATGTATAGTPAGGSGGTGNGGNGGNGGSGVGSATNTARRGGGGGGAGGNGASSDPRNGGPGKQSVIATALFGTPTYYGGGGGGASRHASTGAGAGGIGGGGAGAQGTGNVNGGLGGSNTGGGGGGRCGTGIGGNGGSGIVIVRYLLNSPPTITDPPSVNYGGYSRLGPSNSPGSISFEAEDAEDTGADALTVEVRTAASGGGTLVATDDYTSGTSGSISVAHNASGLSEGSNTLYMRIGDGSDWSDDESFTVLVDRTDPASFTPSSNVTPVLPDRQYTVAITANDSHSTSADELTVEVRTGASGGGTLLWTGSRTASGTPFNTGTITDAVLVHGSNTRYARVIDGAGNIREVSFTVDAEFIVEGEATASIAFGATAAGIIAYVPGEATAAIAFTATVEGGIFEPYVLGEATASIAFVATAAGVIAYVSGEAEASIAFDAAAAGVIAYVSGEASASIAFSATAAGVIAYVPGEASAAIAFTATAEGQVFNPFVFGEASASLVLSATAAGFAWPIVSSIPNISPRRREPLFYLSLYPPVGSPDHHRRLDQIDINPLLTGISWQTSWPGGFAQLTAGYDLRESALDRPLANPLLPREMLTRDYAHVLLTDGRLTIWEGRLGEEDRAPDHRRTLAARGYGYTALSDHPWQSESHTPTSTAVIVRSVIAEAAPAIRPASARNFQPPLEERVPVEFAWVNPLQVLDQLHIEGDDQGLRMDWGVWEDRRLHMYPRQTPAIADYWIPYDSRYLTDWRYIPPEAGQVYVRHTVAGTELVTGPVTNNRFVRRVGFQRSIVLIAGEVSVDGATRIARTYLQEQSTGRYVGQVVIGPDDALMAPGGRPVPSYLVRAGQWLQVGDHQPLLMVTHEHSPTTGRSRLQIGDRVTSYTAKVNSMLRDQERERRGMHPGGGRIR